MLTDDELSRIPCYLEDKVKNKECDFCIVCFVCPDYENMDVVTCSSKDFQLHIMNYFSDVSFSDICRGFYIQVLSVSTFIKVLEIFKNEKGL